MVEAVDVLVTGGVVRNPEREGIALLRVVFAVAIGFCSLATFLSRACADETEPPPTHPIWTLVPTHIDRDREKHVRLEPKADATDDLVISVDHPIRIGPEGTFNVDGKPTQIFGMVLPDRQTLCETPSGPRWACGIRAQAAFVALLATRALACERVSPLGTTVTVASCKAGNDDIAERLIGDGWAEADKRAGIKLKSLEEAARTAHRGQWRLTIPEF